MNRKLVYFDRYGYEKAKKSTERYLKTINEIASEYNNLGIGEIGRGVLLSIFRLDFTEIREIIKKQAGDKKFSLFANFKTKVRKLADENHDARYALQYCINKNGKFEFDARAVRKLYSIFAKNEKDLERLRIIENIVNEYNALLNTFGNPLVREDFLRNPHNFIDKTKNGFRVNYKNLKYFIH